MFPASDGSIETLAQDGTVKLSGSSVTLHGWIDQKPKKMSATLAFAKLRDTNGDIIQLVDRSSDHLIRKLKPESAVAVSGKIEETISPNGDKILDLVVNNVKVLNAADVAGSQLTTGEAVDNIPPEYRFMQLRRAQLQRNLKTRAKILSTARSTLDGLGFTEIETPLLFKSTPEGAREFLVPTRRAKHMYALPQSPQQYKQLLMASGVHRYYQVAKCFRDEDLRADRQPEFTQLDIEMSFSSGKEVRKVLESVVHNVWESVSKKLYGYDNGLLKPLELSDPFPTMTYDYVLSKFGIDKPDLRYMLEIQALSCEAIENADFPVLELIVLPPSDLSAADFDFNPDLFPSRSVTVRQIPEAISEYEVKEWLDGLVDSNGLSEAFEFLQTLPANSVVAFGTRARKSYENPTPLGKFRQLVIEKYPQKHLRQTVAGPTVSPDDFVASWVVDFPLFNPIEESSASAYPVYSKDKFTATHHPFTMVHVEDYDYLAADPLAARGQHYDMVMNGVEVGGGSTRIHDVDLQKYIFEEVLGIKNYMALFGHLLKAFETGCPPHAGFAIGFDRMTAMLCGTNSIRDVIAFPKTITGADPMIGSPSKVTSSQLKDYHIKV